MKNQLLKIIGLFLSLLIFLFVDLNEDSIYRMQVAGNSNAYNFNSIRLIFSEPLPLLIASSLKIIGLSNPIFFQLTLYLIILLILSIILKKRMYLFPIMLGLPSVYLLSFNIQPMMISILVIYYILDIESSRNIKLINYKKDLNLFVLALLFHWSSLFFLPYILIRAKCYKVLFFLGLGSLYAYINFIILDDISVKLISYSQATISNSSILHVYTSILMAIFFISCNIFFRKNNKTLQSKNYQYFFLILISVLIVNFAGFKAGSRFIFIVDLFLILDFIKHWWPSRIIGTKIYFNKSLWI
tara:strand:- start:11857 stop:12756 length:900 start_codon:yes stop_codon:yes gene_type:complete